MNKTSVTRDVKCNKWSCVLTSAYLSQRKCLWEH